MKVVLGLLMAFLFIGCRSGCSEQGMQAQPGADAAQEVGDTLHVSEAPLEARRPWIQTFGGQGDDEGLDLALGPDHAVIVAGRFSSTMEVGNAEVVSRGGSDAIVAVFETTGELIWVKTLGGSGGDVANGVVALPDGGVAVTGRFEGVVEVERPEGDPLRCESAGQYDAFIIVFDQGGLVRWARTFGGSGWDEGHDIALDSEGKLYVVGRFSSSVDFDPGEDLDVRTAAGDVDAFVMRLSPEGEVEQVATFGGSGTDVAYAVAVTPTRAVAVAGWYSSSVDLDPREDLDSLHTASGFSDLFVSMMNVDLELQWSWTAGGPLVDQASALSFEDDGALWVTGFFVDTMSIRTDAEVLQLRSRGRSDVFVARLDPRGQPTWAVAFGGESADYGYGIASSTTGETIVAGRFAGEVDLDEGRPDAELTSAGRSDAFIVAFGSSGVQRWSRTIGGAGLDRAQDLVVDGASLIVTGAFEEEVDFLDTDVPASTQHALGAADAFVLRLLVATSP